MLRRLLLQPALQQRRALSTQVAECGSPGPTPFEWALVAGGDDRSALKGATYRNKYNVSPWPLSAGSLFRGSCTCNTPTVRGYEAAGALFEALSSGAKTYAGAMAEARERLSKAFELPPGTAVALCPSGSDAEYVPIALARALSSSRLGNVVRQHKEIGAGSAPAANLEYFSESTPLGASPVSIGSKLCGETQIDTATIAARADDGTPIDGGEAVERFLSEFEGELCIVHSVFGGKTGLRDDVVPTDLSRGVLGVVDACQGRFTNAELRSWLDDDCVVLLTGSKFYRGPPFSGAVLVPASLARPLPLFDQLSEFLCPDDLPDELRPRDAPSRENLGLALRWEAALAEIEASTPYSIETAERWAADVAAMLPAETIQCFEANRCIVSLRLRASPSAPWFDVPELRHIYEWMTLDVSQVIDFGPTASTLCSIGQPVQVASDSGVLRLALGVDSLHEYHTDPLAALATDQLLIDKLHHLAANYDTLLANKHLLRPPA